MVQLYLHCPIPYCIEMATQWMPSARMKAGQRLYRAVRVSRAVSTRRDACRTAEGWKFAVTYG
jgi:hypothetical protein